MPKLEPNHDGVLPCTCGAYPILVEADTNGGTPPMGYVCLNCPAAMKPRKGKDYQDTERVALSAWNTATINEYLVSGAIDEREARRLAQDAVCNKAKVLSAAEAEELAGKRRISGFREWGTRKAVQDG